LLLDNSSNSVHVVQTLTSLQTRRDAEPAPSCSLRVECYTKSMATITSDKKLRSLIKESVREVLGTEIMKLRALALPEVSDKEQKDIEKRYGKPSGKRAASYSLSA